MEGLIDTRERELHELCRRYGVARLDLFGSAAGGGFDPEDSDLDFVISFLPQEPPRLFDRYFGLKEDLEFLFDRNVDLLMEGAMKHPSLVSSVNEHRLPLYEA